jgi:hypothetical protein
MVGAGLVSGALFALVGPVAAAAGAPAPATAEVVA